MLEMLPEWLQPLAMVLFIDVVLAGDNAIVVGMAAAGGVSGLALGGRHFPTNGFLYRGRSLHRGYGARNPPEGARSRALKPGGAGLIPRLILRAGQVPSL